MFAETHVSDWLRRWHRPPAAMDAPPLAPLQDVRRQCLAALDGCEGARCDRLRARLQDARAVAELWHLRGEIFDLVARQRCQAQAAERVNGLLPAFEGWVPARQLTPIRGAA